MAELRRRPGAISKGMKVTAVVEDAINDVLVVSLNIGSRQFRGILLDATKRNIPHGLNLPPMDKDDETKGEISAHSQTAAPEFEHSATTFRHTYLKPTENTNNSSQIQLHNFPRPFKDRPSRNIRLRPRSTLCSKCKAVCHETDKGIIPVHAVGQGAKQEKVQTQTNTQSSNLPRMKSPQREGLRKRQHVSASSNVKNVVEKSTGITRSSPYIKINIGEGTVLKIPPRLHDEVDGESNTSQAEDNVDSASNSQDSDLEDRKTARKVRDRFSQSSISVDESDSVSVSGTAEMANHHKKHKRKHKHKRDSVENDEKLNTVSSAVDENVENPDAQNEVPVQRPRLLYTWRQNKGLSPRRENMDGNVNCTQESYSPKHTVESSSTPDLEVKPKVIVRSKSVDLGPKKEYKLRSREKRVSTDSSESQRVEQNSGSDFDKYSMISSASENEHDESEGMDEVEKSSTGEDEVSKPPAPSPVENTQNVDVFRSLMMKIHTRDVTKCIAPDGRTIHVGDIVWGKIKGFPWWPGRVLSISVSERESGIVIRKLAHVSWFGSSTMSHIQCSDLYPFLEDFKLRYNRKKRGPYKVAIKQATIAAQSITNTHHIDFSQYDL